MRNRSWQQMNMPTYSVIIKDNGFFAVSLGKGGAKCAASDDSQIRLNGLYSKPSLSLP